jgi:hypothetical protein
VLKNQRHRRRSQRSATSSHQHDRTTHALGPDGRAVTDLVKKSWLRSLGDESRPRVDGPRRRRAREREGRRSESKKRSMGASKLEVRKK